MKEEIHIGKEIEQELRSQDRGVTWLARKLNCDRSNVYKIFQRPSIDTNILMKISEVLGRNFFEFFNPESEESSDEEQ